MRLIEEITDRKETLVDVWCPTVSTIQKEIDTNILYGDI